MDSYIYQKDKIVETEACLGWSSQKYLSLNQDLVFNLSKVTEKTASLNPG